MKALAPLFIALSACLDFGPTRFASPSGSPEAEEIAWSDCASAKSECGIDLCGNHVLDDGLRETPANGETDVDCGGHKCQACVNGSKCLQASDCQSHYCNGRFRCDEDPCKNGRLDNGLNGSLPNDESDVDCGGDHCPRCGDQKACHVVSDCQSEACVRGRCIVDVCTNRALDAGETDIDCGGTLCRPCSAEKQCENVSDCWNGECVNRRCTANCPSDMSAAKGFCIDNREVSLAQYRDWLSSPETAKRYVQQRRECLWNLDFAIHDDVAIDPGCASLDSSPSAAELPVRCVDWCDANAFCQARGKQLCGHRFPEPLGQWLLACANGTERLVMNPTFPYGATYDGSACNGLDRTLGLPWSTGWTAGNACHGSGQFETVFDLSGNVAEWVDSCGAVVVFGEPPTELGEGSEDGCGVLGGSFRSPEAQLFCQASPRQLSRNHYAADVGFRCCSAHVAAP